MASETIDNIRVENDREHETVADIAAVLRRYVLPSLAERLEAAWKRERAEVREIASTTILKGRVFVGNAAAMREALSDACYAMFNFLKTQNGGYEEMANALDKAKATLSAPARNCDRFADEDDAFAAWHDSLNDGDVVSVRNAFRWLFAPAAERKGDGDGR